MLPTNCATITMLAMLMAGCGADSGEPPSPRCDARGDLELQCQAIADLWCCGTEGGDRANCLTAARFDACPVYGEGGACRFESPDQCVRSSVDFEACLAVLDQDIQCRPFSIGKLPAACRSDLDRCSVGDCVEQPEPFSGVGGFEGAGCSEMLQL